MNIKELSKLAGVSVATVSYVLNDSGNVSDETRQKVLRLAKEYNYKPNSIAKSLRTNKSNTIGVLVEDITVWFAPEIIKGISKYADSNQKNIILSDLGLFSKIGYKFQDIEKYKQYINDKMSLLLSTQVDGIIYVGMHDRNIDNVVEKIKRPIVFVYCYTEKSDDVYVTYDNTDISYEIGEILVKRGHRKIAAICGAYDSKPSYKRFCGFKKALYDNGVEMDDKYVKFGNWQSEQGYSCAKELLMMEDRPTAIFAFNDLMAAGALKAARELKISVPNDLSIIGFDDRELSSYISPMLSTVKVPLEDMGVKANEVLGNLILKKKLQSNKIIVPCAYVDRETVGNK
ncbi:LacI family DNA-binding transcriptional regulator [Clostridium oryzae]|uniref:Catabolite control protein A n=1 Tax=Clostridium oryzae TaxID=1450648 RepID=A0A1V4IQ53_9CLOT|nr:LacI family DNA-binding transcriptional regulator [Clostridium oryzae]OPJ62158.1 catabolite control protein A [Clostridium oryzae]